MEGIFDGMWGFDISTEIKNDHDNDDVMIMCILLVKITDIFCYELDSRYCGALSNRIIMSYLHPLGKIKRISPKIKRHFFLGGMG